MCVTLGRSEPSDEAWRILGKFPADPHAHGAVMAAVTRMSWHLLACFLPSSSFAFVQGQLSLLPLVHTEPPPLSGSSLSSQNAFCEACPPSLFELLQSSPLRQGSGGN